MIIKENKVKKGLKYILFLIQPWIGLFYSLHYLKTESSKQILLFFAVCYGLAFVPALNTDHDSVYYYEFFYQNIHLTFNQYLDQLSLYFSGDPEIKDIYNLTTVYLVSRITHNFHILFGVYALVFALFAVKSFNFLTRLPQFENRDFLSLWMVFIFLTIIPIQHISGVRFWTAAWMAIYIVLKIILDGKIKYAFYLFLLPLVHGSFWIFVILYFGYLLSLRLKENTLIIGFFATFFLSEAVFQYASSSGGDLGIPKLNRYIEAYASQEYKTEISEARDTAKGMTKVVRELFRLYPNLIILIFILKRKSFRNIDKRIYKLFPFLIVLMSFVNLTNSIPSVGSRYMKLFFPIMCIFWLSNKYALKKYRWVLFLYPLVHLEGLFKFIMRSIEELDPYFYVSPFPYFLYHISNLF